jgi:hypothetical protein
MGTLLKMFATAQWPPHGLEQTKMISVALEMRQQGEWKQKSE